MPDLFIPVLMQPAMPATNYYYNTKTAEPVSSREL
jgi:hypothetical protein